MLACMPTVYEVYFKVRPTQKIIYEKKNVFVFTDYGGKTIIGWKKKRKERRNLWTCCQFYNCKTNKNRSTIKGSFSTQCKCIFCPQYIMSLDTRQSLFTLYSLRINKSVNPCIRCGYIWDLFSFFVASFLRAEDETKMLTISNECCGSGAWKQWHYL